MESAEEKNSEKDRKIHKFEKITKILESGDVLHYSCNAPNEAILKKYGIDAIGNNFGLEKREIVVIPRGLYEKFGMTLPNNRESLVILSERILAKIEEKEKRR